MRFLKSSETWSRALIGGLCLALAWRFGEDFLRTGRPTDLLFLVGELLVVILMWLRHHAIAVDRRAVVRVVTALSIASPLLVEPGQIEGLISEAAAVAVAGVGLVIVIGGKLSLGSSFGLLPANRGVVKGGLYRFVRHPIYLGYLISHVPFLAAHPSAWNLVVLLAGDIALLIRAFYEEQTLSLDPTYVRYCSNVKWRLVPGVC
jgi:protein-S-isoprenylcysteine O-methyltransferase Ste14